MDHLYHHEVQYRVHLCRSRSKTKKILLKYTKPMYITKFVETLHLWAHKKSQCRAVTLNMNNNPRVDSVFRNITTVWICATHCPKNLIRAIILFWFWIQIPWTLNTWTHKTFNKTIQVHLQQVFPTFQHPIQQDRCQLPNLDCDWDLCSPVPLYCLEPHHSLLPKTDPVQIYPWN